MDRLRGFPSFLLIAGGMLLGLRLLHVSVPVAFPETRQGPVALASLDDVRGRVGFAPLLPAYRPATLGDQPVSLSVLLSPRPTFTIVWQEGDQYLSVTQRQGGPEPEHPPLSRPLDGVEASTWWIDGARRHLVVARGEFWIEIETSLPLRDLKRLADTLTPY